jgi:hypothetical protein
MQRDLQSINPDGSVILWSYLRIVSESEDDMLALIDKFLKECLTIENRLAAMLILLFGVVQIVTRL